MARTGVLYSEVAEAAAELIGQGKRPTVEQIRLLLGTGSSTTISNHLRRFKATQEEDSLLAIEENIPAELVAVLKGLWQRVLQSADEKIKAAEEKSNQVILNLGKEVDKYKNNNQRWQKLHEQWQAEKNKLSADKLTLEQALELVQKENNNLKSEQTLLIKQQAEKQERIQELHVLHKQAQSNLEHYRESSREQRILEQQQFDQQKQQLQFEIKSLTEKQNIQRETIVQLQHLEQELKHKFIALEENYNKAIKKLEVKETAFIDLEKLQHENQFILQQLQKNHKTTLDELIEKNATLTNCQMELKLLQREALELKQLLQETKEQNKLLSQEKWILAQEKAQLQGQLKQTQKLTPA